MSSEPSFTSPSIATHFLPLGFSPSSPKICSRRVTWPEVWRRCSSNASRNCWLDAAFAIFGSAFTSWVSALYRSRSSSMYNSRNESCGIVNFLLRNEEQNPPAEADVRVDRSLLAQNSSSFCAGTIPLMLYGHRRIGRQGHGLPKTRKSEVGIGGSSLIRHSDLLRRDSSPRSGKRVDLVAGALVPGHPVAGSKPGLGRYPPPTRPHFSNPPPTVWRSPP